MSQRRMFLEFDSGKRHPEGHVVLHLVAGPVSLGIKEPAGIAFHTTVLRQQGLLDDPPEPDATPEPAASGDSEDVNNENGTAANDGDQTPAGVSWKGSNKKKKKDSKKKGEDYYALLGLKNERWTATPKQLKDAYRKVCLENHPDKKLVGVTDEGDKQRIEERFKMIQEAYTVLSDPAKRREYDSIDEFDDSLPTDCAVADFFKVFGPAFRRNARWSVDPKVPDLGEEGAPWEEVDKFYDFWFGFKSWREFPHPDEEDVEGAESREHRRWIERNNSKLREGGKKDEKKRLKEFVEAAYRLDPRVAKKKEEDRMERERKKQEKEDARRRVIEEEERKKAEEEAKKKAQEEAEKLAREEAKKVREALKKATKKERQRLRAINDGDGVDRLVDDDDIEKLTTKLDMEGLSALSESMLVLGLTREQQREIMLAKVLELSSQQELEWRAKEAKKKAAQAAIENAARLEHERKVAAMREWNDEELRMLDKAVAKFPQGTPKRWEQVTAYVRTRTLEEVLLIVKEQQGMSAARMRQSEDFRAGQKKRAQVTSQADLRMNAFTDVEVNLVGAAATLLDPTVAAAAAAGTTTSASEAAPAATPAAAAEADAKAAAVSAQPAAAAEAPAAAAAAPAATAAAAPAPAVAAAAPAAAAAATAPKKVASADSGVWTEEQELALVKAMKVHGKELADRWERVSADVPGKTKAQCFKRFKELRDMYRSKKTAGGGADGADDE